jgi:cobalt-precorrin-5B (C1)-methyltransferase
VEVLDEAGSPYYYSTRTEGQQVELLHGVRLEGSLDVPQMMALCREHDIRLIVDAAHPFAEELHRNLIVATQNVGIPIIRYDRIYPPRAADLTWCTDYQEAMNQLEAGGIRRLLALTGVNNIGTLRPYWSKAGNECWVRILNRQLSQRIARKTQFPEDHLVYYEHDDTATLLQQLKPQAILTKESGVSGGFLEKVEAARQAGVKVLVIMRPEYPPFTPEHPSSTPEYLPSTPVPQAVRIVQVNGPHGLRRAVEQLLPDFFPLKSGLTTGTCATAAAVAAATRLLKHETPAEVPVMLPDGETIHVAVGYGPGYAYCIKQAGDDPDVTNGLEIRAMVEKSDTFVEASDTFHILGGEGVGRFTLPGFDYPPGEAAINRVPRQMIRQNLERLITPLSLREGLGVRLSVPGGADIARRTFNPRLGIEGGISIIGVSGIVKPFSEEAFIDSIRKCMQVAKASGSSRVVINSGAKSERFLKARYPGLPQQCFVQYGNYIGETLRMAHELQIPNVTLGVMLGKAVKLAEGQLDTHSRRGTMNIGFVRQLLREAGCDMDISHITLARELWEQIPQEKVGGFVKVVIDHCRKHCGPLLPDGHLTLMLISDEGEIYG